MTNSQLTREKVQWLHDAAEEAGAVGIKLTMNPSELLMFTSSLLAAMDTEQVAKQVACWSCRNKVEISAIGDCDGYCPNCNSPIDLDDEPYTAPQPALDRDKVRREHAEWSQATFGDVGPVGPLKHLSKEALEAAAEPGDLSEWADMQFLLWDAQRRAGITDEQITQAMIEKLAVNKLREWPEPKDGEPRLHIKEQSAPVMPNFKKLARELVENLVDCGGLDAGVKGKYLKWTEKTCRSAMLPATPPAPKQEIFNVNHLMIDLETMGNKPTAPIVTIGAVFFDPQTGCLGAEFYMAVNLASAMEQGATPDGDTILWWLKQSEAARAAICTDDTKHIAEVLSELSSFISRNADNPSYLKVWGNGANFDNVILRSAYDRADKTCPWQFWNDSDVRTMVLLGKELGFDPKRNMPFDGVAHNALADARHQAKYVSAIWQKLFPATSAEE